MNDELKLLIEWPSRWDEFVTSIRPALGKSPRPLAGEARTGLFPHQGMLTAWICEALLLLAAIVLPTRLAFLAPYQPPSLPKYDVIYFSGDELPQTEDLGGAKVGRAGKSGGQEAYHRTQVIRVSRGDLLREKVVDAPRLNLPQVNSAVANLLAYNPLPGPPPAEGLRSQLQGPNLPQQAVAPAPDIRRDKMLVAPALDTEVAPTPEARREKLRASPSMNAAVIPPSPSGIQRDVTLPRVPGSQVMAIVPPPVSAPEQMTTSHAQLTLPAPAVVSPPPSQVEREAALRGPGFGPGELQKQIVPPPVQVGNAGSTRSYGGVGNQNVVPPPVQVNGAANGQTNIAMLGNPNVVAPPVQASGISGERVVVDRWGIPRVVPPPVQVDKGSMRQAMTGGIGRGNAVVPPPPSVSADAASGMGHGNRGRGLGSVLDSGSVTAPAKQVGGSGNGSGVVLSSQPGATVAKPGSAGAGALALSPNGGANPGLGGPGGGGDIARGQGSGAALSGEGPGASNSSSGTGADTIAHNGISPYPGAGGAGTGSVSKPAMPGVSVHGGSNVITLPSFGADSDPASIGRSSKIKSRNGPEITVVGSSRSGGAFNLYGELKGDKVYTIYIDTKLGPAVMEYADPTSANHPYAEDLVAPQPMRADLPPNIKMSRT
ncbi:MAG: hypothetical protein JOZ80_16095, partial [Acidobacteriaceae bacterium]|nr:hypothetical protein [Acidobacteriaceae bacterium]